MEVLLRRTDAGGCFKVHPIQASFEELLNCNILLTLLFVQILVHVVYVASV